MKEATVAEPASKSLAQILDILKSIDDDMPAEEFDPAVVVGELRDKVDAIKWRIDTWKSTAKDLNTWVALLQKRSRSIIKKVERLEAYVKYCMVRDEANEYPGHIMKLCLQRQAPGFVFKEAASPETYSKYPGFVKVEVERKYQWEEDIIKNLLREGEPLAFATMEERTRIVFSAKGTK